MQQQQQDPIADERPSSVDGGCVLRGRERPHPTGRVLTSTPLSQSMHRESGYFTDSNVASPLSAHISSTHGSSHTPASLLPDHFTFDDIATSTMDELSPGVDSATVPNAPSNDVASDEDERGRVPITETTYGGAILSQNETCTTVGTNSSTSVTCQDSFTAADIGSSQPGDITDCLQSTSRQNFADMSLDGRLTTSCALPTPSRDQSFLLSHSQNIEDYSLHTLPLVSSVDTTNKDSANVISHMSAVPNSGHGVFSLSERLPKETEVFDMRSNSDDNCLYDGMDAELLGAVGGASTESLTDFNGSITEMKQFEIPEETITPSRHQSQSQNEIISTYELLHELSPSIEGPNSGASNMSHFLSRSMGSSPPPIYFSHPRKITPSDEMGGYYTRLPLSIQYTPIRCVREMYPGDSIGMGQGNRTVDSQFLGISSIQPPFLDFDIDDDDDVDDDDTDEDDAIADLDDLRQSLPDIIPRYRAQSLPEDRPLEARRVGRELRKISDEYFFSHESTSRSSRIRLLQRFIARISQLFHRRDVPNNNHNSDQNNDTQI